VLIMINTRDRVSSVTIPTGWQGQWFDAITGNAELLAPSYSLDPYEVLFLSTAPLAQPGDFDFDGYVDGRDFLAWQRGDSPSPLSAEDLAAWQTNYGVTPLLTAAATAIPEPATIGCGLAAVLAGLCTRRQRAK
jgi:hypothetical protein